MVFCGWLCFVLWFWLLGVLMCLLFGFGLIYGGYGLWFAC